jgi:hypothetical protein
MIKGLEELGVIPTGALTTADIWDGTLLEEAYKNEKQ